MALLINLRQLEKRDLVLEGQLSVAELELEGVDECVQVALPLTYHLAAQWLNGNCLIQGRLRTELDCTCVRCLKVFRRPLELDPWVCHVACQGEDAAVIVNDGVDLTPYLREDILLSFPQHPLCEARCNGLPRSLSSSVHQTGSVGRAELTSSAWAELNKLKL